MKHTYIWIIMLSTLMSSITAHASHRVVNLIVSYKNVCNAGRCIKATTINNEIPGPTLHFKEGDHVTINVYNHLDKGTSIHWHGILVPWQMDGVSGVAQKPIPPGCVFHYQFTLYQSGTYWYHSHTGAQEQQGLYGAFIIDPKQKEPYHYTKDFTIVLSDWIYTNPENVYANLKKSGDYYSPRFPLQPSLTKFMHDYFPASIKERHLLVNDYLSMQRMRMGAYDISDIAYDTFLLNGRTHCCPWIGQVKVGDIVRLRFIGASASTNFRVKIPGAKMQVVHVQGNNVQPYALNDFFITPGETYDVLVKINDSNPYIIYAESADTIGAALGALVSNTHDCIPYNEVIPFPEPLPVIRAMHNMMHGMSGSMHANHSMHQSNSQTLDTKYQHLEAAVPTNNPKKLVDQTIKMQLFGYMGRFLWLINGTPEYLSKPIQIQPGKRYRLIFDNASMMHHPMHIHGHWFILRNGHGAYDPLLHTIDVAPGAHIVVDIDADASGQWFFHCHHLYHMMAGMARVFQYSSIIEIARGCAQPQHIVKQTPYINRPIVRVDRILPIDPALVCHPSAHKAGFYFATLLDIGEDPFHKFQRITYKGMYGYDYHKLEIFMNETEITKGSVDNADVDVFYWHLISQFWALKGGVNYFYRPTATPYWQPGIGIEGLMPFFIDTNVRAYFHQGSTKLDIQLSRDTQITNNFFIGAEIRSILATKTITHAKLGSGLNQMQYSVRPFYRLAPGLTIFTEYEHEEDYGVFKNIEKHEGQATRSDTLTFGFSILF